MKPNPTLAPVTAMVADDPAIEKRAESTDAAIPEFLQREPGDTKVVVPTKPPEITSWRDLVKIHPAADLLPLLSSTELRELADDIRAHGLQQKVVVAADNSRGAEYLLDGRNRLDALELLGEDVTNGDGISAHLVGRRLCMSIEDFDPYDYVISLNLRRRHLTAEQKRQLIADLLKANPGHTDRHIAGLIGASPTTVGNVRSANVQIGNKDERTEASGRKARGRKPTTKPAKAPKLSAHEADLERMRDQQRAAAQERNTTPPVVAAEHDVVVDADVENETPTEAPAEPIADDLPERIGETIEGTVGHLEHVVETLTRLYGIDEAPLADDVLHRLHEASRRIISIHDDAWCRKQRGAAA